MIQQVKNTHGKTMAQSMAPRNSNSYDIVADAPNTYTVEQVLRATEDVTAIELKSRIPAVQKHLDNLADPDYTEFLRLQAKFKN